MMLTVVILTQCRQRNSSFIVKIVGSAGALAMVEYISSTIFSLHLPEFMTYYSPTNFGDIIYETLKTELGAAIIFSTATNAVWIHHCTTICSLLFPLQYYFLAVQIFELHINCWLNFILFAFPLFVTGTTVSKKH